MIVVHQSVAKMQQIIYQHYNNEKYYKIIDWCKIQVNDEWVDAYIYVEADKTYHVAKKKYVRSIDEFHQKFKPVLDEETLYSIKDSSSLLEMIRGEQLSSILGKFKIF